MTKNDFMALAPEAQDAFLDSGGTIEHDFVEPSPEAVPSFQSPEPPSTENTNQWSEGFNISDPVELLYILDPQVARGKENGGIDLHNWQIQFMLDFANKAHSKDSPFRAAVRACNGSGKDKLVVAACAVWLCMRFAYARAVATNGSGVQLDNQTELYIRHLCERANTVFNAKIWKCNYRDYECLVTQSPITLFATDEPNKAEGFHPIIPGGKLAIFASEAKAIPDSIFTALTRCTGYTHRVDVSTPGLPMGYFYDTCMRAVPRKELQDIKSVLATQPIEYHITAFDCPHITQAEIDSFASSLAGGVLNPVYKSGILSEFGTTDEMVVIPYTYVWKAVNWERNMIPLVMEEYNTAGLDLSDGGAETVLLVRNGNRVLKVIAFRFDNTEDTLDYLEEQFKANGLNHREALIYADCCGIGKPMLNALRKRGWSNIRYVDSRAKARESKTYLNRGTELFFNARLLLEKEQIRLINDELLVRQLSTRYYKINNRNIHQLLSKLEQKSRGYPSPDRADAFNLAFWGYKCTAPEDAAQGSEGPLGVEEEIEEKEKIVGTFTLQGYANGHRGETKWVANNGIKDFSSLQEEVALYNSGITNRNN